MPLTRDSITAASRIMLPAYVVFFAALGINYLTTSNQRLTASPGLAFADERMPLPAWGLMFLAAAATMTFALVVRRRTPFRLALWVCAVCMIAWAAMLLAATLFGHASPTAAAWPTFVAVACLASDRSLLLLEV